MERQQRVLAASNAAESMIVAVRAAIEAVDPHQRQRAEELALISAGVIVRLPRGSRTALAPDFRDLMGERFIANGVIGAMAIAAGTPRPSR